MLLLPNPPNYISRLSSYAEQSHPPTHTHKQIHLIKNSITQINSAEYVFHKSKQNHPQTIVIQGFYLNIFATNGKSNRGLPKTVSQTANQIPSLFLNVIGLSVGLPKRAGVSCVAGSRCRLHRVSFVQANKQTSK